MIVDKHLPVPEDPTPADAPPSYEEHRYHEFPKSANEKESPSASSSAGPSSVQLDSPAQSSSSPPLLSQKKVPKSGLQKWFPFGQTARATQAVKQTVLNLVREVVTVPDPEAAISLLKNCEESCTAHGLSFSSILQEQSVEDHTPIYWAIIKRPPDSANPSGIDLVQEMLAMASPLTENTISEIRLACLTTSDQRLFQRLRRSAAFAGLSGSDEMLLGGNVPPDDVLVEEIQSDDGAFLVHFCIVMFQKRMRISRRVGVQFIARGRMWQLQFVESDVVTHQLDKHYPKGTWLVELSLIERSPPTFIDSHLLISDARTFPIPPSPSSSSSPSLPNSTGSDSILSMPGRMLSSPSSESVKPKPTIELRIKTNTTQQLAPRPKHNPDGSVVYALHAPLNKTAMGSSLQFDGSSYISPDGSLSGKLEARLAKPDAECIIC